MVSGKIVLYRGTMCFSDDPGKLKDGQDNNNQADDIDHVVHGILHRE
ncbi:hypothetical protein SAMN05216299_12145 [Nitrosospira sp. Nsp14]|jgi:hypothetical protein|nr:hypothetical protein [Nitrosospira sp. Nsp14]SFH55150.1 hypothetical protein SAMN05216299_12145 [Nitrosospira sp. Nsp14]